MPEVNFNSYIKALQNFSKGSASSGKRLFREEPKIFNKPVIQASESIGCTGIDGGSDHNHNHDANYVHGKPQGDHGEKLGVIIIALKAFLEKSRMGPDPIRRKLSEDPEMQRHLAERAKNPPKPRQLMDKKHETFGYMHDNPNKYYEPTDKDLQYGEKQNRTIRR